MGLKRPLQVESKDLDQIVALLASNPRVGAVYVFGSVADGVSGDHSDVDLALVSQSFHNPLNLKDIIRLRTLIATEFPDLQFDLVLIDQCPPILQCEILRHQPTFCTDRDWEALEKSRLLRIAWDAIALARPHEQALLRSLKVR